jgi:hypothetical protein
LDSFAPCYPLSYPTDKYLVFFSLDIAIHFVSIMQQKKTFEQVVAKEAGMVSDLEALSLRIHGRVSREVFVTVIFNGILYCVVFHASILMSLIIVGTRYEC